jgi:hypothetical protein
MRSGEVGVRSFALKHRLPEVDWAEVREFVRLLGDLLGALCLALVICLGIIALGASLAICVLAVGGVL